MMIQWAAQDYDSLNWFIILRVSFDTSNFRQGFKTDFLYNFWVYLYPLKRDQHWWSNVLKTRKGRADRELVKTTSVT